MHSLHDIIWDPTRVARGLWKIIAQLGVFPGVATDWPFTACMLGGPMKGARVVKHHQQFAPHVPAQDQLPVISLWWGSHLKNLSPNHFSILAPNYWAINDHQLPSGTGSARTGVLPSNAPSLTWVGFWPRQSLGSLRREILGLHGLTPAGVLVLIMIRSVVAMPKTWTSWYHVGATPSPLVLGYDGGTMAKKSGLG